MKELIELIKKRARQAQRRLARRRHHAVAVDRDAQARARARLRHRAVRGRRPDDDSRCSAATRRSSARALGNYVNLIKEGKLRALAVTAKKRSAALPDVPTLDELGIKGQEAETMTGVFVPAGTPKAIVDLLQQRNRPRS